MYYRYKDFGVVTDDSQVKEWYFYVPGVKKEDLEVYIDDEGKLKIVGKTGDHSAHYRVTLPHNIDRNSLTSKLENGVLYLSANKTGRILIE
jgi:HSP20 family molecular chaperone IbpA